MLQDHFALLLTRTVIPGVSNAPLRFASDVHYVTEVKE